MEETDKDLLLRISLGEDEAFERLFRRYRSQIFNYLFKISKSRESSEEMVTDVFVKLWQSREILNEINNFPSFIFQVARNKAYDFLRMAAKDRVLEELIWNEINAESDSRTDGKILFEELQQHLDHAISKLSPQRQVVFRMSREQHLTHDQIATHLSLSKSTVKNHMIDALRFVREHMKSSMELVILLFLFMKE
ncbi:RNA polymerase ECF-type sigma factor [Pedobacter sp. BAL39]|uniref:RNA polymerase sigma-70 factor n=1 Tax=Pedobacter sp. BAL39 TaxID=391596 RepID=UPI0001559A9F|nr:RNA polymerase sigma-70 factor [Pedobacter sp. BAL39]EDM37761.1 RNA polymerase ECF-type sigma factor [Pedobacter sp. BAL39]